MKFYPYKKGSRKSFSYAEESPDFLFGYKIVATKKYSDRTGPASHYIFGTKGAYQKYLVCHDSSSIHELKS